MKMRLTAGLHPFRRTMNSTKVALNLLICFVLASSAFAKAGFRGTVLSSDVARKTPAVSSRYHLDDFPVEVDIAALAAAALVPRDTGVVKEIASVTGGQDVKEVSLSCARSDVDVWIGLHSRCCSDESCMNSWVTYIEASYSTVLDMTIGPSQKHP